MTTKKTKYDCIFDLTDDCPVKRRFKLRPESLVEYCRTCPILKKYVEKNGKAPTKLEEKP